MPLDHATYRTYATFVTGMYRTQSPSWQADRSGHDCRIATFSICNRPISFLNFIAIL
jgi:hypothetical protein